MSHYPSTQELAVFRRSIALGLGLRARYMSHPTGAVAHPPDGAWPHERRDGIGYRIPTPDPNDHRDHPTQVRFDLIRREASSLRSRAYARMDYCACQHPDRHYGNLPCRVTPESSGVPLGPNGYCWSCWSAKHDQPIPTDTWTEDEPRHPLPIRYQPSFTIG